ncbi:hypothetical protein HK405_012806, partial [Cladochytrium tenue]
AHHELDDDEEDEVDATPPAGPDGADYVMGVAKAPGSEATADYASMPKLVGLPAVGDRLAFRLLELSTSYTPELTEFKEAAVVAVDARARSLTLRLPASFAAARRVRPHPDAVFGGVVSHRFRLQPRRAHEDGEVIEEEDEMEGEDYEGDDGEGEGEEEEDGGGVGGQLGEVLPGGDRVIAVPVDALADCRVLMSNIV